MVMLVKKAFTSEVQNLFDDHVFYKDVAEVANNVGSIIVDNIICLENTFIYL